MIEAVESGFIAGRSRHSSADRVPVKRETAEGARVATQLRGPWRTTYFYSNDKMDLRWRR